MYYYLLLLQTGITAVLYRQKYLRALNRK